MSALGALWALRRRRPGFVAVSLGVLAVLLAFPVFDWYARQMAAAGVDAFGWATPYHFRDYGSYATAVTRWYRGELVYWRGMYGDYYGTYLYPPVYVLAFAPFTHVGEIGAFAAVPFVNAFEVEGLALEAVSVLVLWVGLQRIAGEAGLTLAWYDRVVSLWALVGFFPLLFSVKLGQVSALVAGLLAFAYVRMERGARSDWRRGGDGAGRVHRLASGALTTVAAGVKPYYAPAGAHLLRDRDRLLGAVGGLVALAALSVGVFGVANNLAYLDVLAWGKGWGTAPDPIYMWHPGYYRPFYPVAIRWPTVSMALRVGLLIGVAGLSWAARSGDARRATFALGVAVYPLAAPEVYTQDFVALLVPAVVLVAVAFDRPSGRPWLPVLAVGLLAVHAHGLRLVLFHLPTWLPLREAVVAAAPLLQPGLWGNLLLVGLAAARVGQAVPWTALSARLPNADAR